MKTRVLVFPCGSEIGLEVNRALVPSRHFALYGASSVDDHGKFVYENYVGGLPFVEAPSFLDELNRVIEVHRIAFVIPAHDSAVLTLAEKQALIGATVVTSCAETCSICRSKRKTYEVFAGLLPTPRVHPAGAIPSGPVFIKPDVGQATRGAFKVDSPEEAERCLRRDPALLALEFLPGREYTVDCFTDRHGRLRFAGGRERRRVSTGISVNSSEVTDPRFRDMAEVINRRLAFRGVWFYQVKERADGELVLLEIAPRIAGTMGLFRADGVNFAKLSLFDRMGLDVEIVRNHLDLEIDRALCSRYALGRDYAWVYVDFDDTILVDNRVNTAVMQFLYQARNGGKKIVLLTRHKGGIRESLRKAAISEGLFDEIVVLDDKERKSARIANRDCVLIDDSFAERKEVSDALGVPVFAVDAVEALLSWTT